MKTVFILLFLVFGSITSAQIINFPDANFKNALVNSKCVDLDGDNIGDADVDLNNDGEIDVSEAQKVSWLNISRKIITSLEGINKFSNLTHLDCHTNQLTLLNIPPQLEKLVKLLCYENNLSTLDVSGLGNLNYLECCKNKLFSLKVAGLKNLLTLDCAENQLTSLDLTGLENLQTIDFYKNKITTIDLKDFMNLKYLRCSDNPISFLDITGLEKLEKIFCLDNQLSSLDLSGLENLQILNCSDNQLKSITLTLLKNLQIFSCDNNLLTSIDLSGLENLKSLFCYNNQLTSINLSGLKNLKNLLCYSNQLTSLDLSGLKKLEYLSFDHNELTSLDLSELENLKDLRCSYNQLTTIDVTRFENLEVFGCSNNKLTSLFIKTGKILSAIDFSNNFILNYICCNENDITNIKNKAISYGLTNCEVNAYCTFNPSGKFYVLNGKITFDGNTNGCEDQYIKLQNFKYKITDGITSGSFITNFTGNYSIPVQAGTHTITPMMEHPSHFEVTPSLFTVTFPSSTDTITQNFCITPKGIFHQTNITVIPLTPPARPGFETLYKIVWENAGNQIESGTLNFTYDETLLDYISATQSADQIADGIIKWNFTNLLPFEKREITVTLKVNRPTDTPAVNAGDKLYLTASILDNIFTLENTVVGSYDPNDKTCLQGDRVKLDMVGEYVDYLIRFENTGNYAAENVVVKDIIDSKRFDVSSLQITDASHEVYTRIEGNKVEFIFEKIQLPFDDANNDGYIAFKIKTLPTLVLGDSLKNMADIYFDYNFPIRTNEAKTTIALSVPTADITTDISIYPNPVRDILHISTEETWTKAEIYDISGRILRQLTLDGTSIDVSILESGTYFIRLKNGNKIGRVKFVKI